MSEPIDGHSLKVSTKNYRGRVKNKRDERANDYMSSYKGALVGNIPNNILNAKKASINEFFKRKNPKSNSRLVYWNSICVVLKIIP